MTTDSPIQEFVPDLGEISPRRPLAIVTGGSRGLGFEVAKGLIQRNYRVVIVGKDAIRTAESAASLGSEHRIVDVADSTLFRDVLREISDTFGTPEVLVLSHGVMSEKLSKTLRTTDAVWRRVMSVNTDAVFAALNEVVPQMAELRRGRVVVFSACLGRMSGPGNAGGLAPYRVSKAAVNALVRNLAHETGLGARGLLVDAICPGHCRTDMGGADAPKSAEEGADTAIWLATRTFNPTTDVTGVLWEDREIVPW